MRLFQILALASFALLSIKLIGLAASGAFDGLAVTSAQAQGAANSPVDPAASAENNPVSPGNALNSAKPTDSRTNLLSRLSERRDDLNQREKDLKLREKLLKVAEKRLEAKLKQIKDFEKKKSKGGAGGKSNKEGARDLVIIYESMKPKDAARIFDALSIDVLHGLARAMSPRKMSAILAEMEVKAAERLTIALATEANIYGKKKRKLSKIGG